MSTGGIPGGGFLSSSNPYLTGEKKAPPMRELIRQANAEFYGVRQSEKPVKVNPGDDSGYWAALGYTA